MQTRVFCSTPRAGAIAATDLVCGTVCPIKNASALQSQKGFAATDNSLGPAVAPSGQAGPTGV